jgi:predicted TIM-barrel fold metal-dependent hydrolase
VADRVSRIRARLSHPVIDSDGHYVEFLPLVKERVHALAGPRVVQAFENVVGSAALARRLDADTRRKLGMVRIPWWGLPARNTLDRATALLPRLLYQRLDEIGLDFAVLYPTYGLFGIHLPEEELRRASCRAFNEYAAEAFGEYRDRLAPAAAIPMHTPEEAIDELRHAVGTLELKVVMLAGYAARPFPGGQAPRGARWLDFFGFDSPHDYDPVWAECERLGVSPSFHSTGMGWGSRGSLTNYVYNHIGNFAAAGEGACRALFLSGVPWRFPKLRFAFLEGGVGWACSLYSDLLGHWEKRNRSHIAHYDPANLDRALLEELFRRHASEDVLERLDRLDESLHMLSEPDEDRAGIDEFARCEISGAEDIRDVFTGRFHFGCEADDPMNAAAFATRTNPLGARLRAIFSSDIGHWDVPDMTEVLPEAWELVEDGLLSESDFRDFVFGFPAALWAGTNPDFFRGTVIETDAAPPSKAAERPRSEP